MKTGNGHGVSMVGTTGPPIIFFDGGCGLCNRFVDFVIDRDAAGKFRFSPLQGDTIQRIDLPAEILDMDTICLVDGAGFHTHSDAVLRVLIELGGVRRLAGSVLLAFPRGLRDRVYAWVARHRIGWFGAVEACNVRDAAESDRFLP